MKDYSFIVSRDDWSLHRKGQLDQQRHQQKVREAIKENLADIVSEEAIIMSDGGRVIKVPIRSLDEYRFRFNHNKQQHVGQGDGKSRVGDVLGRENRQGDGAGSQPGDQAGRDYYEAEITVDELAEMVFADLSLPNLKEKSNPEMVWDDIQFNDVRKKGLMGNVDKKRTLVEALRRSALSGAPGLDRIDPEDLRFKTWEDKLRPRTSAVVLAMMDTSGSMGTFEKYIARGFFFWMVRFLRTRYKNVQVVFLAHHTEAREVSEQEFFTKGESGGTKCSSVYELALQVIDERYPPRDYNIYPFHFSDGDNLPFDNPRCAQLVTELLEKVNAMGYAEINPHGRRSSLMSVFSQVKHPGLVCCTIRDKSGVYPALRAFFGGEMGAAEG